MIIPSFSNLL